MELRPHTRNIGGPNEKATLERTINPKMMGGESILMESEEEEEEVDIRDVCPYPNHADDPDPIPKNSSKAKVVTHKVQMKEYSQSMYNVYAKSKMRGEMLWQDFITAFRPHTIRSWPRPVVF